MTRRTTLPGHVVQFCRFLRARNFACGPREEHDVLSALAADLPGNDDDFASLLRAALAKNKGEYLRFPDLFQEYWGQLARAENDKVKEQETEGQQPRRSAPKPPTTRELKDWLFRGRQTSDEAEIAAYTAVASFTRKDFSSFSTLELQEVTQLLRRLAHLLHREGHRRYLKDKRPPQLDLRRSILDNLARGGDIEVLRWRKPKPKRQHITVFCDVSKSMDLYSRFLLQFMYGFQRTGAHLETFVFSTSLSRVTPLLANRELASSLQQLSDLVPQWSGGTDLGASLREYRTNYGRRHLGRKTTVLILSDGWDQGDTEVMDYELRFIHRHARRLIWINPLAGQPGFQPQTKGMRTALPYLDHLTSAHNLETLVELVRYLGRR